jgi:hypothetical protein
MSYLRKIAFANPTPFSPVLEKSSFDSWSIGLDCGIYDYWQLAISAFIAFRLYSPLNGSWADS